MSPVPISIDDNYYYFGVSGQFSGNRKAKHSAWKEWLNLTGRQLLGKVPFACDGLQQLDFLAERAQANKIKDYAAYKNQSKLHCCKDKAFIKSESSNQTATGGMQLNSSSGVVKKEDSSW